MEELIRNITLYIAAFLEGAAALVIAIAAIQSLVKYLTYLTIRRRDDPTIIIRLKLGRALSLSLEFLLGADILKTAIAPTWNEIGQLAAIAVLRTTLNHFLERELQSVEKREQNERTADHPLTRAEDPNQT